VTFKIDMPANRYDLLCLEGLARALRLFIGRDTTLPPYRTLPPTHGAPLRMDIKRSVAAIRPHVVCAVLRGVSFTTESYQSFIDLQEKLHNNICRKRTLVSVGTHDLDTIQGPFSYEAVAPSQIQFVPLNQTQSVDGNGMMALLDKDLHLRAYLPIIRDSPVYPVVYDAKRVVCSVPPIINGEHSKISLKTKNVLIEVTATDRTKALIVLDTMTTMFGEYTAEPFRVEQVEVHDEATGKSVLTPDFTPKRVDASLAYLTSAIGVPIDAGKVVAYLARMGVPSELVDGAKAVRAAVPPTRSDIIHACDVMEDVAIGYGFNNIIAASKMPQTVTAGAQQPLNKLCDQLRNELAQAAFTEVLTLSLCSHDENFAFLNHPDDGSAIRLANPKTLEYQVVRTQLYAGLLKTFQSNKKTALPLSIFEISDVAWKSAEHDVGARNRRYLCAMYTNTGAGFEIIHGLLDRLMLLLEIPADKVKGYSIEAAQDGLFFEGRCARVLVRGKPVGLFGVLHPTVLDKFDLQFPVSALQLDVEAL